MAIKQDIKKFHILIERKFVEYRGELASKMREKNYTVKKIAETLKTSQQQIYYDLRKMETKKYMEKLNDDARK